MKPFNGNLKNKTIKPDTVQVIHNSTFSRIKDNNQSDKLEHFIIVAKITITKP
jgi:hypothetical protein